MNRPNDQGLSVIDLDAPGALRADAATLRTAAANLEQRADEGDAPGLRADVAALRAVAARWERRAAER